MRECLFLSVAWILSLLVAPAGLADEPSPYIAIPEQAQPILTLDQLEPGMTGYGLTIFHGTTIEPFSVRIVSVVPDSSPGHGVIWITSDDERMVTSSGAQGMSGSPIYIWDDKGEHTLGQGGKLIGAFAFVYSDTVGSLAGVQPIQYMRGVGGRVAGELESTDEERTQGADVSQGAAMLRDMDKATAGASPMQRLQLDAALRLLGPRAQTLHPADKPALQPMALPIAVSSPAVAEALGPMLASTGLSPVAGPPGLLSTAPIAGIDAQTKLQPGSVLAVPLAFGDMDLSAHGTVTDVLPDGTVLGFGHAMDAVGPANAPMATGYIHFVVPRTNISFRVSSSLNMAGTLLRDEMTAVAGASGQRFVTAPLTVEVNMPDQSTQTYHYQVAEHPSLTPTIVTILALQSLQAVQDVPLLSTTRIAGELDFSDDRSLKFDSTLPGAAYMDVAMDVLPPVSTMMLNPFQRLKFTGGKLSLTVTEGMESGQIVGASIDQGTVQPGETVGVNVQIQQFEQPVETYRGTIRIPPDMPEGDYRLLVSDAASYLNAMAGNRRYLFDPSNMDQLQKALQRVLTLKRDAVYLSLSTTREGVAVGQDEMSRLPSSVRTMVATPLTSTTTRFTETVDATIDTDVVPDGVQEFVIKVREPGSTFEAGRR